MSNSILDLVAYVTEISNDKTNARNISIDPTGVVLSYSAINSTSSPCNNANTDKIITQTLEGYVLPLLPSTPPHIHNIHLTCKTITGDTAYYLALQLPSYKRNIGKYQILDIVNIPVSYVFYPNGTIDIYTKNSENPFKLQTEEDRAYLMAFFSKIKDNLPPQIAVPDVNQWEFTECDINRDIRVSDILHISSVKVQVKHMDHLFRIYIKRINKEAFCRVEETKNLKMPVIEAINHILNPYDSIERQLSETQHLLSLRRQENFESVSYPFSKKKGGDITKC
jgi:hypothetical protein